MKSVQMWSMTHSVRRFILQFQRVSEESLYRYLCFLRDCSRSSGHVTLQVLGRYRFVNALYNTGSPSGGDSERQALTDPTILLDQ